MKKKKAFTLLELIIVIIIIGVLVKLALPKMFTLVERARAAEAVATFATLRSAIDRCILMVGAAGKDEELCEQWGNLDIEDPSLAPGSHFNYQIDITPRTSYFEGDCGYYSAYFWAYRNSRNGFTPSPEDYIYHEFCPCGTYITEGHGIFEGAV